MQKLIRVNIGGKDYSLRGDDEEIIQNAASEVNQQLEEIKGKTNEPIATQSLLAALNIAEKYCSNKKQADIDSGYLISELDNMVNILSDPLNKAKSILTD